MLSNSAAKARPRIIRRSDGRPYKKYGQSDRQKGGEDRGVASEFESVAMLQLSALPKGREVGTERHAQ
jgi:hypothetical protein